MAEEVKIRDGILSSGKLLELLAACDPTTRTIALHLLGRIEELDEDVGRLQAIVAGVRKTFKYTQWAWPFVLPIAGFLLRGLV